MNYSFGYSADSPSALLAVTQCSQAVGGNHRQPVTNGHVACSGMRRWGLAQSWRAGEGGLHSPVTTQASGAERGAFGAESVGNGHATSFQRSYTLITVLEGSHLWSVLEAEASLPGASFRGLGCSPLRGDCPRDPADSDPSSFSSKE